MMMVLVFMSVYMYVYDGDCCGEKWKFDGENGILVGITDGKLSWAGWAGWAAWKRKVYSMYHCSDLYLLVFPNTTQPRKLSTEATY